MMDAVAQAGGGWEGRVLGHRRSARVAQCFALLTRRMFAKRFSAVRAERGSMERLLRAWRAPGALMVAGNHPSWWDPLVAVMLNARLNRDSGEHRGMLALMERAELERFGIFRRLGVFGVDPDDPASLDALVGYLGAEFRRDGRQVFWVTPQGHFTDVRAETRLRPGAAAVATGLGGVAEGGVRVVCLHMEYVFWNDQKPELLLRVVDVDEPAPPTRTGWHRAVTAAMEENRLAGAALAVSRDVSACDVVVGRGERGAGGLYGVWQRLRGKGGALGETRRAQHLGGTGGAV